MTFFSIFLILGFSILGIMFLLWLFSLALKNSSIVDIFWGIGFIIVTWTALYYAQGYLPRKQLIAILVTLWGTRLALHIGVRNWGKPEDFRYAQWRADSGTRWQWLSFLTRHSISSARR